jgi:type IV secretion system protein VirD4
MGFADGFKRGFANGARTAPRRSSSHNDPPPHDGPSPIKIGYYCDPDTGQTGAPNLYYGERHLLLFGLNGAGKSTRFLIELLMTSVGRSILVLDIKGELAAQTAHARRRFGDVKIINPYGVVGLPSHGYNPLATLDPNNDDEFSDRAALLADAVMEIEGKEPHWSESAQGMFQAGIMWEVIEARRERRAPSLFRVRQLLTEADAFETFIGPDGKTRRRQIKGLAINAARMIEHGGEIIASLVGRFVREHGQGELSSIQSTFDTQTRFLLSPPLARDLQKSNWSFRQLRERPTTVYAVLPASEITRKRRWTRALMTDALCAHFRPGPISTLFVLDEFRAAVGHMPIINDVWSLVRGYGIQLLPVVQSATQLRALFKDEWENYAAQAGAVFTIGPPGDLFTADWMSRRCGVTTVLQMGFNEGSGVNSGFGANTGTGTGANGGVSANQGANNSYGSNISDGLSYQQVERRVLLPQELMDMAPGNGRIWLPGMGSESIPFFAPNYWWRRSPFVAHVRPNPYRQG